MELLFEQREDCLLFLKKRFENNMQRNPDFEWEKFKPNSKPVLESRKEHKPANNAVDMAAFMGNELLRKQYRALQEFGAFDLKHQIRKLGGTLSATAAIVILLCR